MILISVLIILGVVYGFDKHQRTKELPLQKFNKYLPKYNKKQSHKYGYMNYQGQFRVSDSCSSMSCDRSYLYYNNYNQSICCPLAGMGNLQIQKRGQMFLVWMRTYNMAGSQGQIYIPFYRNQQNAGLIAQLDDQIIMYIVPCSNTMAEWIYTHETGDRKYLCENYQNYNTQLVFKIHEDYGFLEGCSFAITKNY